MNSHIRYLIEKLEVTIIYGDGFNSAGMYFEEENIILINSNQNDFYKAKTLLHELGHAAKHKGEMSLYNLAFSLHSKMENEAEEFMIEQLILHYLEYTDKDNINWLKFMEDYEIEMKYEHIVKALFTYYVSSPQFISFME
ncbi:ImmA/IrrE family metallo-endopeptidase [Enterococcus cecorum]|uniref:ImmA/IrrE family metallo-endopeptidase n=1 Tax=Enterococcus cecorum TaxID=44008 RepID=UPI0022D0C83A|nr:ImmA/IrrE family metallo-endopeptidase [Enterococcus cecorum]CAI3434732.1 ImmA/IrrE family metallo-endopeptidase [Enterococcus cecorum]CAI3467269.1 ImmA/IrrE family metallo-endopeptidase [Enterococcus cecorum]